MHCYSTLIGANHSHTALRADYDDLRHRYSLLAGPGNTDNTDTDSHPTPDTQSTPAPHRPETDLHNNTNTNNTTFISSKHNTDIFEDTKKLQFATIDIHNEEIIEKMITGNQQHQEHLQFYQANLLTMRNRLAAASQAQTYLKTTMTPCPTMMDEENKIL